MAAAKKNGPEGANRGAPPKASGGPAESYQGWANYETWAVHLWLTNSEEPYRKWMKRGREAYARAKAVPHATRRQCAVSEVAGSLQAHHAEHEVLEHLQSSVFGDLMTRALSKVNWHEVADAFMPEDAEAK